MNDYISFRIFVALSIFEKIIALYIIQNHIILKITPYI